ncbi:MAG TPA: flagellar motor switch protein FliM, partial [Cellvibrionales bacterium]|nr:flagellar motor switch protein FliM [Cellvibrionales bacterium]
MTDDILSQEEIDALLHGVDDGDINIESDIVQGDFSDYDLTSQDRIIR